MPPGTNAGLLRSALRILPEVADALSSGAPVVAFESTIIAHGMPRPQNLRVVEEASNLFRSMVRKYLRMRAFTESSVRGRARPLKGN